MNMKALFLSLLLLIIIVCDSVAAQIMTKQSTSTFSEFDGRSVFNVIKDNNGFIWFATRAGVSCYSGRTIKHYPFVSDDLFTDADGHQISLRLLSDGSLWSFSDNGKVFKYDPLADSFLLFFNLGLVDSSVRLNDIALSPSGAHLWLASSDGVYLVDSRETSTVVNPKNIYFKKIFFNTICFLPNRQAALGSSKGVYLVDMGQDESLRLQNVFLPNQNILSFFCEPQNHTLWIGSFGSGLSSYHITKRRLNENPAWNEHLRNIPIRVIRKANENVLFVGTDGKGVYQVDLESQTAFCYLSENENQKNRIKGNGVYDILFDKGYLWVASYTGGVSCVNSALNMTLVNHIPFNGQSLNNDHVNAVLEDKDRDLWFATNSGVSVLLQKENKWVHLLDDGKVYLTLCQARDGSVWCGGFGTGTYQLSKHGGVLKHILSFEQNAVADCVYASFEDDDGNLWMGGLYHGLTCIDPSGNLLVSYPIKAVNSIARIDSEQLMINTSNGFYILNRRTKLYRHCFNVPEMSGVKSSSFIYKGVAIGHELWFGTAGGGLNVFDMTTDKVVNYSTKEGLPSNFIQMIVKDRDGKLWISTDNGISCFDPEARRTLFNVERLPVNRFNFMSGCLLHDGSLAFGSVQGCLFFSKDELSGEQPETNFHFTDFKVAYQVVTASNHPEILDAAIDRASDIYLRHDNNSFSIGFTAVDPYYPDRYMYSYLLEGFDKAWTPNGDYLNAEYTNIPPGEYCFIVRCVSKDNQEILSERRINIHVHPSFWATSMMKILYAFILFGLLWAAVIYWKRRQERQRLDEKLTFFINIAHDIRTPLSLVKAPLEDLARDTTLSDTSRYYLKLARGNCEKLFAVIAELLDFHKMEIQDTIECMVVNVSELIRHKYEGFEILATRKDIIMNLQLPEKEVYAQLDADKLNHILDNLLSNAVKYTLSGGRVTIRLDVEKNKLSIKIADTGIGISQNEQKNIFKNFYRSKDAVNTGEMGIGIGLVITRRLVQRMKGTLNFDSRENMGTTFTLVLPYAEAEPLPYESGLVTDDEMEELEEVADEGKHRILVVDDDNDMRDYLKHQLSAEYKVYTSASAEEALSWLEKHTVDIIVSDVMMGTMNGVEFCSQLKNDIRTSHLFVVLLTACTSQDIIIGGLASGADDYITKPFSIDVLRIKLENLMRMRLKIQRHYSGMQSNETSISESQEAPVKISSIDEAFLSRCRAIITDNLSDNEFFINELCREVAMSRTLVYEKLRNITGQTPSEFIRAIRLHHAKVLLETTSYPIAELALMVGFTDAKYFSTVFKKYYNISPSQVTRAYK